MRRAIIGAGLAIALSSLAGVALAEDGDNDRLDDAWADLTVDQEGILTDAQFAALNNLSFQMAATKICDGYDLDQDKLAKAVDAITSKSPENMSTDDAKQWETAVLFRFGASYGLFLAEGNAKSGDFCKSAAELKDAKDIANIWK